MTNLTEKFTALEQLLTTQHTATLGKLTAISGQLAQVLDALGTRADCVANESIIGLLCRLNNAIDSTTANPLDPPLFTCPGYEANPWMAVTGWQRYSPDGNPSSIYNAVLSSPPANMYVVTSTIDLVPGDGTTTIPVFQSLVPDMPICVAIDGYNTDGFIEITAYNPSTGELLYTNPIKSNVATGHYNNSFITHTAEVYSISALQQYTNTETTPTSAVWIIRGGTG